MKSSPVSSRSGSLLVPLFICLTCLSSSALQAAAPDLPTMLAKEETVSRLREIPPYIENLRPEEVPAALKQAIAGHGPGRNGMMEALSGRWVELDAPAALAFSRETGDRQARYSIQSAYYGAWVERDAEGALDAANHVSGGERATAIWLIAHKMAAQDPQRAYQLIKSIRTTKMGDNNYFIFWNWAHINLPQATETLLREAKVDGYSYPCQVEGWAITDRLLDDDPKAATKWVEQLPPGKVRDQTIERIISEWAKIDKESAILWVKSQPESDLVRNAISNLSRKTTDSPPWHVKAEPAFAAKADQLNKILWTSNFWQALKALLPWVDGLTSAEFPQALEHLRNAPDIHRDAVMDVLVARWSEVDPAGAIKAIPAAATIHDNEFSERFLADTYAAWARRDSTAALAAAIRDDPWVGNFEIKREVFVALARKDAAGAYATFRKLKNANSHLLVIPIFTEWAIRDLTSATKALSTEPQSNGAIEGIVIGLMRKGPAAAIAWAEDLPDKSQRDRALQDIALRWNGDPASTAAWLEQTPDFDRKDNAFDSLAVDWVVRNPMEALRHADGLPDGKEKDSFLFWGFAQMAYDDAEAAQRLARQVSGEENRKKALRAVLAYWGQYSPEAAADFLSSIKNEATASDVASVAENLSDRDPASAVQWLNAFPASLDKAPAIGKIAENWYRTDRPATESWVSQLPTGSLRDAGARGISVSMQDDLPPALKWARSIRDPKIRHDAIYQAFEAAMPRHSMRFDGSPELKKEIQSESELTDAEKTALIARLPVITFEKSGP